MLVKRIYFGLILALLFGLALVPNTPAQAAILPDGFTERLYAGGTELPTKMTLAPDGRIFVAEQSGGLRVIKDGELMPEPFVTVETDDRQERGLVGLVLDPDFAENQYVYIYYTTLEEPQHNRVVRYTADGDVALEGSEIVIFESDPLNDEPLHNGGALRFGPNGKLYIGIGDNAVLENAQSLESTHGKILRINPDGTIPEDNPFIDETSGKHQAIWALGLRNPFAFAFEPRTGRIYVNDVGQDEWEEVNEGVAGGNYGWPQTEGEHDNPDYISPLYAYPHGNVFEDGEGCAVVGGSFYNPLEPRFPEEYIGDYFFGDICATWIKAYDAETDTAEIFLSNANGSLVDLRISSDGYLYYLLRNSEQGFIYRVDFGGDSDWVAPNGTIAEGNPIYTWTEVAGANSYELYIHRNDDMEDSVFHLTEVIPTCEDGICAIDVTTLPDGDAYQLVSGDYSAWVRPEDSVWLGPFPFTVEMGE